MRKSMIIFMLVFGLTGFGIISGCGNGAQNNKKDETTTSNWWENPGRLQIRGYVAAFVGIGQDKFNNLTAAQRQAELEAKRKIRAFLGTKIQSLAENWDKQAGDLLKKGSLSSYVNNETITREIIDGSLEGALPLQYKKQGENYYVLMGLKTSDFMKKLDNQIESNLETMLLTDAMKSDARKRLDKLINKEKEKINKNANYKVKGEGTSSPSLQKVK